MDTGGKGGERTKKKGGKGWREERKERTNRKGGLGSGVNAGIQEKKRKVKRGPEGKGKEREKRGKEGEGRRGGGEGKRKEPGDGQPQLLVPGSPEETGCLRFDPVPDETHIFLIRC